MASANPVKRNITAGPCKFDLLTKGFCTRQSVHFVLEGGNRVSCILNTVGYEDGSGNKFMLSGYVENQPSATEFRGYFDTAKRLGWITF